LNQSYSQERVRPRPSLAADRLPQTDEELLTAEENEEDWRPPRSPTSVRRYQGLADIQTEVGRVRADALNASAERAAIPARRSAPTRRASAALPRTRRMTGEGTILAEGAPPALSREPLRRPHWLLWIGLIWLAMIVGWLLFTALAGWWQVTLDDWRYGRPRTFQIDAVVGHNDSPTNKSHFIAINLNRHIEIIEFPGGDPTKAKVYIGPVLVGPGQDLAPVTLSFQDVNGDGRPDMIVTVEGTHIVFINENGAFRPARPGDTIKLS
jgi:hypothetical protein